MPALKRYLPYIVLCILLAGCNQATSSTVHGKPAMPPSTATPTTAATPTVAIPGYQPLPAIAPWAIYPSPDDRYFISSSSTPSLTTLFDQQGKALGSYTLNQIGAMSVRWFPDSSGAILWYTDTAPYPNAVVMDTQGHTHQLPFNATDVEISNDSQWIAITRQNAQYQAYVSLVKRSDLSVTELGLGQTLGWAGTSLLILKGTDVYAITMSTAQHLLGTVNAVFAEVNGQSNESPDGQVVFIQTQHGEYFATNTTLINYPSYNVGNCGSYAVNGMTYLPWVSGHTLLVVDAQGKLTLIDIISGKVTTLTLQIPGLFGLPPGQCSLNGSLIGYFNITNNHFIVADFSTGTQHDFSILPINFWRAFWFGPQRFLMQGRDGSLATLDVSSVK